MSFLITMNNNPAGWENFFNPQLVQKLGCTLQAYGANFEPDAFLDKSNIPKEKIIFTGALGFPAEIRERLTAEELDKADNLAVFDTPYLVIKISDAADISSQTDDAILFLTEHSGELKRLCSYPNIESTLIRFSCKQDVPLSDVPAEIRKLTSEIGLDNIII